MARETHHKLLQRVFEARYDGGYRYLDRCGDVMLILEDALGQLTEKVWMPRELAPAGATLVCPDLDMTVRFDTYHLVVDQNPAFTECGFTEIAEEVFAATKGRFDLSEYVRLGFRSIHIFAADSLEEAEKMAVERAPLADFPGDAPEGMSLASTEVVTEFALPDHSKGIRFKMNPAYKAGIAVETEQRLKVHPRLLPQNQRQALLEQQRRHKIREEDPDAGLVIDMDYYWIRPSVPLLKDFWREAEKATENVRRAFGRGWVRR